MAVDALVRPESLAVSPVPGRQWGRPGRPSRGPVPGRHPAADRVEVRSTCPPRGYGDGGSSVDVGASRRRPVRVSRRGPTDRRRGDRRGATVVVVGGGIIGTTHAYWALDNGFRRGPPRKRPRRPQRQRQQLRAGVGGGAGPVGRNWSSRLGRVNCGKCWPTRCRKSLFAPPVRSLSASNERELALMERGFRAGGLGRAAMGVARRPRGPEVNPELSDRRFGRPLLRG